MQCRKGGVTTNDNNGEKMNQSRCGLFDMYCFINILRTLIHLNYGTFYYNTTVGRSK